MSADSKVFLGWEERIISQEKGNRVVHYYLKHFSGDSVLAVVGTERSIRHMIYVVSDDLLNAYGYMKIVNAGTKWRSKREVMEWLTKVLSKYRQSSAISNPRITKSTESLRSSEYLIAGIATHPPEKMVHRKSEVQSSDIEWSGDAWICCKQLMHYQAFSRNGVTVGVYSFAYIMGEGEMRYLAYLEDLYEDKKGQKKVRVRWFHQHQEVKELIPELNTHPMEVFITPHEQVISAECIDGVALVLTPKDYEKYMALHPLRSSSVLLCYREFIKTKVKLFSLSKMRGYSNQITKFEPSHQRLKIKFSNKGANGIKLVETELPWQSSFKVGDSIELLCQDSGMRGCWFRCKLLQASQKRIKVQYYDVEDVDGPGKLEEWVSASQAATPDKLGMRREGRLTFRPWPPQDASDHALEIGAAVDAWWSDGWWEGVVTGIDISGSESIQVYFPGENKVLTFPMKNIRISRDWIYDKWVEIKTKPDILSLVSLTTSAIRKRLLCSRSVEASGSAPGNFETIQGDIQDIPGPSPSLHLQTEGQKLRKQLSISDGEDKVNKGPENSKNDGSGDKGKSVF